MSNLKTNYKDAELSPSMNGKRQYELQYNEAGYTNLVDKTAYTEVGDTFGADDINATNSAVNELNQNLTNKIIRVDCGTKTFNGSAGARADLFFDIDIPEGYDLLSISPNSVGQGFTIWSLTVSDNKLWGYAINALQNLSVHMYVYFIKNS